MVEGNDEIRMTAEAWRDAHGATGANDDAVTAQHQNALRRFRAETAGIVLVSRARPRPRSEAISEKFVCSDGIFEEEDEGRGRSESKSLRRMNFRAGKAGDDEYLRDG
jgi:hypothetical protein